MLIKVFRKGCTCLNETSRKLFLFWSPMNALWTCSYCQLIFLFVSSIFFVLALFYKGAKSGFMSLLQNLVVGWITLIRLPCKSQVLLSWMAPKMVSLRMNEVFPLINGRHLTSHSYSINIVGDSARSERQVSPDKLYRFAQVKNRFLDTILKAREKTLSQVGFKTCLPANSVISLFRSLRVWIWTGWILFLLESG